MSSVKSVFHLFQQRFLRTSIVNVRIIRNASSSTISSTGSQNHEPDVVSMLKSCGFSDTKIAELVAKDPLPSVEESKVGKTLKPKHGSRNASSAISSSGKTLVAKDSRVVKSKVDKTVKPKECSGNATISSPKQLNPAGLENHESVVLNFFKSYGFSDAHIAKLVAKDPRVLKSKVDETLKPKLDCLADYGISGSLVHELIAADPGILFKSSDSHLKPTLSLLKTCLGSNEKVAAVVKSCSYLLSYGNGQTMEDNLNYLVSEGVPIKTISRLISLKPRTMMCLVDRMVHAVKFAKQVGFRPDDPMLAYALNTIISNESTMIKKTELLKNLLGLSEEEVNSMFKRCPRIFCYSEDKLKNVINFFVNTMPAEPSILLDNPAFFSCSVDKTLVPRYNVCKILESKKLFKKGKTFTATLKTSEKLFESNYVVKYLDQVPNLMEIYHGFSKTNDTQSVTNATTTEVKLCSCAGEYKGSVFV